MSLSRHLPDEPKRKDQTRNLAGTVAQNLRDRCHDLSRLSKRQDVEGCASQPASMQQPTKGVDRMTACNQQPLSQVPCEKTSLLRHTILLPKYVHSYLSRSSAGHSITILSPILTGIGIKRGNKTLYSPTYRWKKREGMIETP